MKYGVKMFTKIEKTNRFQSALNLILAEPKNEGGLKITSYKIAEGIQ